MVRVAPFFDSRCRYKNLLKYSNEVHLLRKLTIHSDPAESEYKKSSDRELVSPENYFGLGCVDITATVYSNRSFFRRGRNDDDDSFINSQVDVMTCTSVSWLSATNCYQ